MGRSAGWVLFWVQIGQLIGTAHAAVFAPEPFEKTVSSSSTIVRGTIGMAYSDRVKDNDGILRMMTFYELKITDTLKGDLANSTLMVRELGGQKDGISEINSGAATFETGEEVVLFLNPRNADGSFDLREMAMGKYNITLENGEEFLVGGNLVDLSLQGGPPTRKPMKVSQLKTLISSQAQANEPQASRKIASDPQESAQAQASPTLTPSATPLTPEDDRYHLLGLLAPLLLSMAAVVTFMFRKLRQSTK